MTHRAQWARGLALVLAIPLLVSAEPDRKEKEEVTQVLDVPPEPPAAVTAPVDRLTFLTAPLSSRGLLSRQLEDGFKWLLKNARRSRVVKVRAFVAGSGDLRRVAAVMGEIFADKRLAMPALTVVQVGVLPMVGAQVQLQATAVERNAVNPEGIAFIAGQSAEVGKAVAALNDALQANGLQPDGVRQVTCFLNLSDNFDTVRKNLAASYPQAATNMVQLRRDSFGDFAECEAVAALASKAGQPVVRKPGLMTAVARGEVVLSTMQMAFGEGDGDLRLALDRLGKTLESAGTGYSDVVAAGAYVLTAGMREKLQKLWPEYVKNPAAVTLLSFEGLPSVDATMAVDVIAVKP